MTAQTFRELREYVAISLCTIEQLGMLRARARSRLAFAVGHEQVVLECRIAGYTTEILRLEESTGEVQAELARRGGGDGEA